MQVGSHSSFGLNCWNKVFSPSSLLLMSRFTSFKVSLQVSLNYPPVSISPISFSNTRDLPSWKSRPPPSCLFPNLVFIFQESFHLLRGRESGETWTANVHIFHLSDSVVCFVSLLVWFDSTNNSSAWRVQKWPESWLQPFIASQVCVLVFSKTTEIDARSIVKISFWSYCDCCLINTC